jgi:hypothetical protein
MTAPVTNATSPDGFGLFAGRAYGGSRPAPDGGPPLFGEEVAPIPAELSFDDVLESLNPLQHLPGAGMIYREVTGRSAPIAARILVGAATGGPLGFLGGVTSALAEIFEVGDTLRAIADGRDQPTAHLAWGERPDPETLARARLAYAAQSHGEA